MIQTQEESVFLATHHIFSGFILILFLRGTWMPKTKEAQNGSQRARCGILFPGALLQGSLTTLPFYSGG